MLTYTPNIRVLNLSGNKINSFYRNVDSVASGGFSDALSIAKRARARPADNGATTKTLKAIVQGHVMDQVAMKLQSQNRTKQVEQMLFMPMMTMSVGLIDLNCSMVAGRRTISAPPVGGIDGCREFDPCSAWFNILF
jgi:hypothetical protein